ncbi:MAG: ankyrin repeat domain-containing protein [Verrucomicrobia bacterium]|nr:ankyrin repeat domain-containing protein [Verrucomicrobiota bacterium]
MNLSAFRLVFRRWAAGLVAAVLLPNSVPAAPALEASFSETLRSGRVPEVRQALDQGAPVSAVDATGSTPLHWAAVYGGADTLRLLIERGADVNATNAAGATPLMRAVGDLAKVQLLLAHGANVNARSAMGQTPLILAARTARSREVVELLLRHGADPKATNAFGATALMAAAAGGDVGTVKLLLEKGADPNAQPAPNEGGFLFGGGRSPLLWAAFRGNTEMIAVLLRAGAQLNVPTGLGTALSQAAWADRTDAAQMLLTAGAKPDLAGPQDGYQPLHWATSTEEGNQALVTLLLKHGANPNAGGGEPVDAFRGTEQTPLMLARRRGDTDILKTLIQAGATQETPDHSRTLQRTPRTLPANLNDAVLQDAINRALPPLQVTSVESKKSFLNHGSRQDCTSCHQQHLPMAALGLARRFGARVDAQQEAALVALVKAGEMKNHEVDLQPVFHPDAVMTKGYELLAYALQDLPADANSDAWVHHLAAIQGPDGQWYNNLPRPPLQTGDIGATALAIQALQRYPLPGRQSELKDRVERARHWLRQAKSENTDSLAYQLLGLAWAGESPNSLQPFARALAARQRADGGWSQLPGLESDAYATGQVVYALRVAGEWNRTEPTVDRGLRFLLASQLDDGTWFVRRRAFPFQPTMNSHFPHGRDGWISAAGTSWAIMALSLPEKSERLTSGITPKTTAITRTTD